MKLQEIMTTDVVQISCEDTVAEAAKRMRERAVGCLVATRDGAIKGIITDRDLLACMDTRHDPYECRVKLHMSRPVIVLRPEEEHLTAVEIMCKKRIKRLPVAKDGKLLGIVSLSDLAALADAQLETLESLALFVSSLIKAQGRQLTPRRGNATGVPLANATDDPTVRTYGSARRALFDLASEKGA